MLIKEKYLEELVFLELEEIKDMLVKFLDSFNIKYVLNYSVKNVELNENDEEKLIDIPDMIDFKIIVDTEDEVLMVKDLMRYFTNYKKIKDFSFNGCNFKAYAYFFDCFGFNTEIQILSKDMINLMAQGNNSVRIRSLKNKTQEN